MKLLLPHVVRTVFASEVLVTHAVPYKYYICIMKILLSNLIEVNLFIFYMSLNRSMYNKCSSLFLLFYFTQHGNYLRDFDEIWWFECVLKVINQTELLRITVRMKLNLKCVKFQTRFILRKAYVFSCFAVST